MKTPALKNTKKDEQGSALIIVLAFLFLLTIVTIAFLSRSLLERQLSNASLNQNKIDLVAQGAAASVIGDLQLEAASGAVTPTLAIPGYATAQSTIGTGMEDLLKVSSHSNTTTIHPASSINTATNASLNFRSVTSARWNKALLLAKQTPGGTDPTPVTAFPIPDWIYVARDGSNPTAWDSQYESMASISPTTTGAGAGQNPITQRYSYAVYDEGSTLDMNVAGSPVTGTQTNAEGNTIVGYTPFQPYKNALAYADLTQLLVGLNPQPSLPQQTAFVNGIVGWRNHASGSAGGTFPAYTFTASPIPASPTPPTPHPFDNFISSITGGFLSVGGNTTTQQSDNAFTSRQQLIQFLENPTFLSAAGMTLDQVQTLFPYLGTFSRDVDQPSYAPPANRPRILAANSGGNNATSLDDLINPSFRGMTVTSSYTRDDGSAAVVGDPLVKKRFALNRLAWLTYQGPSALRTQFQVGDPAPATTNADYDMWAMVNLYGISPALLAEGTTTNIQNYFGLTWKVGANDPVNPDSFGAWLYNYHNSGGAPAVNSAGAIMQLGKIAALGTNAHDPDFFELLKATINVGSIAKTGIPPPSTVNLISPSPTYQISNLPVYYQYQIDSSVDYQIMQIGANIITQSKVDGYPAQVVFDDGTGARVFAGVSNFPYLNYIFQGVIAAVKPTPDVTNPTAPDASPTLGSVSTPGLAALVQIPALWNPHDIASDGTSTSPKVPSLRPQIFRIVVDSTPPNLIDPSGAGANYKSYYPLSLPNIMGGQVIPGVADWLHRDTSTPDPDPSDPFLKSLNSQSSYVQGRCLTWKSTALQFTDSSGTLFREPTILFLAGGKMGLTDAETSTTGPVWSLNTDFPGGVPLANQNSNPLNISSSEGGDLYTTNNSHFLGLYLGPVPIRYNMQDNNNKMNIVTTQRVNYFLSGRGTVNNAAYFTYRLQYQDPSGNWVTYDTKFGGPSADWIPNFHYHVANEPTAIFGLSDLAQYENGTQTVSWGTAIDPRTSRFGFFNAEEPRSDTDADSANHPGVSVTSYWTAETHGWIDPASGTLLTLRPDRNAGHYFYGNNNGNYFQTRYDAPTPFASGGWIVPNRQYYSGDNYDTFVPGLLTQNNTDVQFSLGRYSAETAFNLSNDGLLSPFYFGDADGVVRRAMGAYVPVSQTGSPAGTSPLYSSDLTIGLPMARAEAYVSNAPGSRPSESGGDPTSAKYISEDPTYHFNQAQSRPLMLNRPFRSVAELGYVFSGTPWRNLDFSTPESGNAALLDVFCIQDTNDTHGLVAGKVNLNTRQVPVLASIISGAYLDDPKVTNATIGSLSPTAATTIAQALVARTTSASFGPLANISELVGKWTGSSAPDLSTIKSTHAPTPDPSTPTLINEAKTLSDGKASYSGFSGIYISGSTIATSPPTDLSSAYATAFSGAFLQSMTNVARLHESPIRALSSTTQARTWNLLIDVIAQAGRFPTTSTSLAQFNVEGERRYWVHVAIDRLTGNVVDEQMEEVKE